MLLRLFGVWNYEEILMFPTILGDNEYSEHLNQKWKLYYGDHKFLLIFLNFKKCFQLLRIIHAKDYNNLDFPITPPYVVPFVVIFLGMVFIVGHGVDVSVDEAETHKNNIITKII